MENKNDILDEDLLEQRSKVVFNGIRNSYHSFKSSPFFVKLFFVFFLGSQFFRSFIFVTTNRIYKEEYSSVLDLSLIHI